MKSTNTQQNSALAEKIAKDPSSFQKELGSMKMVDATTLSAIEKNMEVVKYLSEDVRKNYAVQILKKNGFAIDIYAHDHNNNKYDNDEIRELALVAVEQDGLALINVPELCKNDVSVVKAAAKQNLEAVKYAGKYFWKNPEGRTAILDIIKNNKDEQLPKIKKYISSENYTLLISHKEEKIKTQPKEVKVFRSKALNKPVEIKKEISALQEKKEEEKNTQEKEKENIKKPEVSDKSLKDHVEILKFLVNKPEYDKEGNVGNAPKNLDKMRTILKKDDLSEKDKLVVFKNTLDEALNPMSLSKYSRMPKIQKLYNDLQTYFEKHLPYIQEQNTSKEYKTPFAWVKKLFGSREEEDSTIKVTRHRDK